MALSHVNSVNSWNAPSTSFRLHYEYVQAHAPGDGSTYGGWTIRAYMQAVNLGNTSSWLGYHGSHHGYYNRGGAGWERFGHVEGNPFLASGVGNGAERWIRGSTYRFNANADGYLNGTSLTLSLLQEIYVVAQSPRWISNTLSGGSEYASGSWSTTLPRILQKPGAPTAVTVGTRTDSTIALTWTAPASNGGAAITSYIVDYAKNAAFTGALSMTVTSTNATLTGLDLSDYYVRVRAKNSVGEGAQSTVVQTATVTYPTAPPAPVAHTQTSNSMQLALTDPSYVGDGILKRQLERALAATGPWTNVPVTMPDTSVTGLTRATLLLSVPCTELCGLGPVDNSCCANTCREAECTHGLLCYRHREDVCASEPWICRRQWRRSDCSAQVSARTRLGSGRGSHCHLVCPSVDESRHANTCRSSGSHDGCEQRNRVAVERLGRLGELQREHERSTRSCRYVRGDRGYDRRTRLGRAYQPWHGHCARLSYSNWSRS